jgi:predicted nucleic acid-binding Zn ribbon protein
VLPQLRNELNCLKEEVIQLRARKRQLTQMLLFLTVMFIAFVGVWLMGCL